MDFTKKKSLVRTQVNEFGTTTALVDAAKSDTQTVATEIHPAADGMEVAATRSATASAPDGAYAQAELVVLPISPSPVIDKSVSLPVSAADNNFDSGKLLGSVYVDRSGGWGLQVAPDNVPDASEQAVAGASEKALEAEVLALAKPVINAAADSGSAAGELEDGGSTDDATPMFSGYGEPFARLTVYDNGLPIGDAEIGADGRWSFTVSEALDLGTHAFAVAVAGAMSDVFMLTIDAPADGGPEIDALLDDAGETVELASGDTTSDGRPTVAGHAAPAAIVELYDGAGYLGAATADTQGIWVFRPGGLIALSDGEHVLTAVADNLSSKPFVLHVDTSAVAGEASAAPAAGKGFGDLVLADLLSSPANELLADQAGGDAAGPQLAKNAGDDSALLPVMLPAELWQQDAVPAAM